MGRVVGLAMPRWDLGTVGYVAGSPVEIDKAYSELFLRCYPTTVDMTREMDSKVSCIINVIRRGLPINSVVFLLDPYGIANDVGTKHGIRRELILDGVYSWFINYLRSNGFLSDEDIVELDQELSILMPRIKARVGGYASMIASAIATIVMVRRVRINELPIRMVDIRNDAINYVMRAFPSH
ncbi:hypothetical protein [Vulcanisaeta sp. JCM 16159]|uniref:hypothetical protein n=1 Tax=Vulcanisaeta sp. JCM 16159 TaxID=1295371 RepID=UPI0006D2238F|nr:hypothetical protein [Vulcanisaeta sp. JCM 16159]